MDTCSWMAITALYTPQLIPESTGGCPEYTTIKCVKLQRGKSWKENIMVVLVQANTYNMYMHGLLLSATRQHKPFLTYWQGWSTALACCCGRCPVSQTHLLYCASTGDYWSSVKNILFSSSVFCRGSSPSFHLFLYLVWLKEMKCFIQALWVVTIVALWMVN